MDPNTPLPNPPGNPNKSSIYNDRPATSVIFGDGSTSGANLAIEVIRTKLSNLYQKEPNAEEEEVEAEAVKSRSAHQQFMYDLSRSGKPLAQIQVEWHEYYSALPEQEKHAVWQEFYAAHEQAKRAVAQQTAQQRRDTENLRQKEHVVSSGVVTATLPTPKKPSSPQTVSEIRAQLLGKVQNRQKLSKKQHFHSILFGLSSGIIVVLIMLLGFFNERFLAPFMTPSRTISASSIIFDPNNQKVGPEPEIIIPKINVQIPVVYDVPTIEEHAVQVGLQRGVVHYATTPLPGQTGNGVIFGHSANNILNKGDYKFAFVLLHKLVVGDTFYINYNGTQYGYKIFERKIVPPSDVSVLNTSSKPVTFTLITCDPPGTSNNRLILVGEQISPSATTATASTVDQNDANKPVSLPSNSPSLWSRFWSWMSN